MNDKSFRVWREKGKHLPEFMRDFHDQKDLFKAMLDYFDDSERMPVSWVEGHEFTIDWFLWYMAAHGYTLQKTRFKADDFRDLSQTIESSKSAREDSFFNILES